MSERQMMKPVAEVMKHIPMIAGAVSSSRIAIPFRAPTVSAMKLRRAMCARPRHARNREVRHGERERDGRHPAAAAQAVPVCPRQVLDHEAAVALHLRKQVSK